MLRVPSNQRRGGPQQDDIPPVLEPKHQVYGKASSLLVVRGIGLSQEP